MTEIRRFDWTQLAPNERDKMIELVRSLGLDPFLVAVDFALTRTGDDPWRLHLSHHEPDGRGGIVQDVAADRPVTRALVFDGVDLPGFLTAEAKPCRRCGGSGRANYAAGGAVYLNAIPCPECGTSRG